MLNKSANFRTHVGLRPPPILWNGQSTRKIFPKSAIVYKTPPGTIEQELHMDVGIKSNGSIYQGQRGATQPTVLAPMAPTKVSADASSNGLGCRSRRTPAGGQSSIPCLMHYAKIEKEALAATWASETLGKRFSIETEHKPLVSLLGTKKLDSLPPTILRFRLCLARFDYTIAHIPGKVADTLSPAPIAAVSNDSELQEEADYMMEVGVCNVATGNWRKTSTVSSRTGN